MIGPNPLSKEVLGAFRSITEVTEIALNIELLLDPVEPPPHIILCTVPEPIEGVFEISQYLSSQYMGIPLLLMADKNTNLNRKLLLKNGFSDVYCFPTDQGILKVSSTYCRND